MRAMSERRTRASWQKPVAEWRRSGSPRSPSMSGDVTLGTVGATTSKDRVRLSLSSRALGTLYLSNCPRQSGNLVPIRGSRRVRLHAIADLVHGR
jgi:hypothetical protein